MRARIIRAYIAKPENIPLISLISQYTRPRDKRDKRVIFPLNSHIYAREREKILLHHTLTSANKTSQRAPPPVSIMRALKKGVSSTRSNLFACNQRDARSQR